MTFAPTCPGCRPHRGHRHRLSDPLRMQRRQSFQYLLLENHVENTHIPTFPDGVGEAQAPKGQAEAHVSRTRTQPARPSSLQESTLAPGTLTLPADI